MLTYPWNLMTICALMMLIENAALLPAVGYCSVLDQWIIHLLAQNIFWSWPYKKGCSDLSPREMLWPEISLFGKRSSLGLKDVWKPNRGTATKCHIKWNSSASCFHSCCSSDFILLIQLAVKFVSLCGFCWLKRMKTHLQQWLWALVILALNSFSLNRPPARLVNDLCPFRASLKL